MRRYALLIVFTLGFLAFIKAMPQGERNNNQDQPGFLGLPFIQLTNGGIRFNFAGYHAEAGLGGLLTGSRTGGGLHASAGTPWGANAAAGLGGVLGGDDATAGGGLYARAGLGNGMPEASAGLGGMLDGSGRSNVPASGGLYAGASTGRRAAPPENNGANFASGGSASAASSATASATSNNGGRPGGRSNIQIISRPHKKSGTIKEAIEASERKEPADPPADIETREVHRAPSAPAAAASAGLYGAVYVDPNTGLPSVAKSLEKTKIVGGVAVQGAPQLAPNAANEVVQDNRFNRERVVYPRWFRKRFWTKAARKQLIAVPALEVEADSVENAHKISRRQSGDTPVVTPETGRTVMVEREKSNRNNGFFDDVFNIPISTLTAVNQLLRNNSS